MFANRVARVRAFDCRLGGYFRDGLRAPLATAFARSSVSAS